MYALLLKNKIISVLPFPDFISTLYFIPLLIYEILIISSKIILRVSSFIPTKESESNEYISCKSVYLIFSGELKSIFNLDIFYFTNSLSV